MPEQHWTDEVDAEADVLFRTLSTREIRERQVLCHAQQVMAQQQGDERAAIDLARMDDALFREMLRRLTMPFVTVIQTHNASVVQKDTYVLDEAEMAELRLTPEADREAFIEGCGKATSTEIEVEDIHETTNVEVKLS